MAVEILEEPPLTPPVALGPYRQRDYDELPDEPRCELLFGRLYVMPAPTLPHQAVVATMWSHLDRIAQASGGRAYVAPLDVALAEHSVVQPDVIYVSPKRLALLQRRIEGAPDLLVEVISPRTAGRDRVYKLMLYAASGVREYWIVDAGLRWINSSSMRQAGSSSPCPPAISTSPRASPGSISTSPTSGARSRPGCHRRLRRSPPPLSSRQAAGLRNRSGGNSRPGDGVLGEGRNPPRCRCRRCRGRFQAPG